MKLKNDVIELLEEVKIVLNDNNGKLNRKFIDDYAKKCSYEYGKIGDSARVCVLTTTTGHKIVGHALVLDPKNDIAEIGNKVAKDNCIDSLWDFLGGLAKMIDTKQK